MNIAQVRPASPPFCISFSSARYEVGDVDAGKRTLYIPICVDGGEWNHASGVPGPAGAKSVGDGERARLRVLCMRVATASSESFEDSSSDEDAEPESESSKPAYRNKTRFQEFSGQRNGEAVAEMLQQRRYRWKEVA